MEDKMKERKGTSNNSMTVTEKRKKTTTHYFCLPLPGAPSVTLITIQLWEKGFSVLHTRTQAGSNNTPKDKPGLLHEAMSVFSRSTCGIILPKNVISQWTVFTVFIIFNLICVNWQPAYFNFSSTLIMLSASVT